MVRPKNVVSTKLALYSHDASSVLVMRYPIKGLSGIPGGHVEAKEHPDVAIRRELMEELTLTVGDMKRVDFFLRRVDHGAIILAYTATATPDVSIEPTNPKFEYAEWVGRDEFKDIVMSPEYTRFVLENWPNAQP